MLSFTMGIAGPGRVPVFPFRPMHREDHAPTDAAANIAA